LKDAEGGVGRQRGMELTRVANAQAWERLFEYGQMGWEGVGKDSVNMTGPAHLAKQYSLFS